MRGRDDRCRPGVVQGNLHANVHCSAKDVEIFLSNCTSRLVGPSHTNPGRLYLKRIMRKLPPASSCSRRKNLKVQRKPLWKGFGIFPTGYSLIPTTLPPRLHISGYGASIPIVSKNAAITPTAVTGHSSPVW